MTLKNFKSKLFLLIVFIMGLLTIFAPLSGCMKLLNLQISDGIYVVGDWNDWVPTENDKMIYSSEENCYIFELPTASMTFKASRSGNEYSIGWYKVIYKSGGVTKVSSGIPVWKENLNDDKLVIYAKPDYMINGQPIGVGDSEKFKTTLSKWYVGGEFNNWNLSNGEMAWDNTNKVFKYTLKDFNATKKTYPFKVTRNVGDWKPWEFNYDGKKYDAGYDNATLQLEETGTVDITITFDPKTSKIETSVDYK
uniref:Uncharacterized protein n=1 Tax=Fervidobacterium nodosum TaxID=2424 RepID=A0A7C5U5M9_9BACT